MKPSSVPQYRIVRNCVAEIVQRVLLVIVQVGDRCLRSVGQGLLLLLLQVLWDEDRQRLYFGIVVRIDAHLVLLQVVRVLAVLHRLQLVLALQIGPAPQTAVDDVRDSLAWWQATSVLTVHWAVPGGRGSDVEDVS